MENFVFRNPTKIIFGKGMENIVGKEAAIYGKNILLHYGKESIKQSGLYDRVLASLASEGLTVFELGGVKPNPRVDLVRKGIVICKEHDINLILAVGGGSVIDSAKAISIGTFYQNDVWDFYTKEAQAEKALPVGTILTIPAAGSESSDGSVITNENGNLKRAYGSNLLYPAFSILNPELAFTLPSNQIANGITDMITHLLERYFTNSVSVGLSDRLIEGSLKNIIEFAPIVLEQPHNYNAWAEIMWSATVAHNNLFRSGRIGDWASHNIEHELSGIYDIAHGAGLAAIFPAWMKFLYLHDVERFAQWAVRVWNVEQSFKSYKDTALAGIKKFEDFLHSIGMTTSLKKMSIDETKIEEMANKCTNNGTKTLGQFVKLKKNDVISILKLAL